MSEDEKVLRSTLTEGGQSMFSFLRRLWRPITGRATREEHPHVLEVEVEPLDLRQVLKSIWQQPGEMAGVKVLLRHEGEALLRTIEQSPVSETRVDELVKFLRHIDPMSSTGWNDRQCEQYVGQAILTVARSHWVTGAFDVLLRHQGDVAKETGARLFRISLLRAAVAFTLTGLDPNEIQDRATG